VGHPRSEIGYLPAGWQWLKRSCSHRSAAAGSGDRCTGQQPAGVGCKPVPLSPPRRSPQAAGPELCADRPVVAATAGEQWPPVASGLAADPATAAGALDPQWRRTAPSEAVLVQAA
jgi:hypothetical protein